MIFAFDIDDTITKCPMLFKDLSASVYSNGGSCHIVSSRTDDINVRNETLSELKGYGIAFDFLYLIPDIKVAQDTCPHAELDWYQKYLWQKVEYCINNKVDAIFDDDEKVIQLFLKYAPNITAFQI